MARERVIVKLALSKVQEALKTMIKVSLYARDSQISEIVDKNLLSLAIKFMNDTNKLPTLLGKVEEILCDSQQESLENSQGILKQLERNDNEIGFWAIEEKFEEPYFKYVYPTTRAIEALAPREPPKPIIRKGVNFLHGWMEEEGIQKMVQNESKYVVPLMQAALMVAKNSRGEIKEKAKLIMHEASKFSTTKDLEENIFAQTVRYTYFIYNNHVLDEEELKPLIEDINSGIFRRMMKGLEFLSALTYDLKQNSTNRILDMLPKFRKQIFDIVQEGKGAVYFASISESMKNALNFYHNKTFARSFFNLMVEESSWISQPIFHPLHLCKVLVGTSLLIFSRGALRR